MKKTSLEAATRRLKTLRKEGASDSAKIEAIKQFAREILNLCESLDSVKVSTKPKPSPLRRRPPLVIEDSDDSDEDEVLQLIPKSEQDYKMLIDDLRKGGVLDVLDKLRGLVGYGQTFADSEADDVYQAFDGLELTEDEFIGNCVGDSDNVHISTFLMALCGDQVRTTLLRCKEIIVKEIDNTIYVDYQSRMEQATKDGTLIAKFGKPAAYCTCGGKIFHGDWGNHKECLKTYYPKVHPCLSDSTFMDTVICSKDDLDDKMKIYLLEHVFGETIFIRGTPSRLFQVSPGFGLARHVYSTMSDRKNGGLTHMRKINKTPDFERKTAFINKLNLLCSVFKTTEKIFTFFTSRSITSLGELRDIKSNELKQSIEAFNKSKKKRKRSQSTNKKKFNGKRAAMKSLW